jgi:hypothetical protein
MRTRSQIEPTAFCPGKVSHERAAGAGIFPDTDFTILAIRYKNHGRPQNGCHQIGLCSALEMSAGELRHMAHP